MHVTVRIYPSLRCYLPASETASTQQEWEVPEGETVSRILQRLELPKEVGIMVMIDNSTVAHNAVLNEGNIIHILPQMLGG